MSRKKSAKEFILLINLKSGSDVRRFCQVRVDEHDNVYVLQPRKGQSVKISYHQSGRQHLKIGNGPAESVMQLDRTASILGDENVWSKSFENFADLLPYKDQSADAIYNIEFSRLAYDDKITFAEISIGRFFDPKGWTMDGVVQRTLQQQVFPVPISPSNLLLCVRVLQLTSPP